MNKEGAPDFGQKEKREKIIKFLSDSVASMEFAARSYVIRRGLGDSLDDLPVAMVEEYASLSTSIGQLAERMMDDLNLVPSKEEIDLLARRYANLLRLLGFSPDESKTIN